MGYLTVKGKLLTYNQYKDHIAQYKLHGIKQFVTLYNAHKDRFIEKEKLHWGDEVEYAIFYFDLSSSSVKLSDEGFKLIHEFNEEHMGKEIVLQPEFGNWMIEAVPTDPYNSIEDLNELLSCYQKLSKRYILFKKLNKLIGDKFYLTTSRLAA